MKRELRGIFLPITTPFNKDGDLDTNGLRANIKKWSGTGISGYVVLGSTGERVHLEEDECERVIAVAREEVPSATTGSLYFMVGAGQQSTRGTIAEVRRAAARGADAVLVITPHFYRSAVTQSALLKHFIAVADSSSVPVMLYSMPALTGISLDPDTMAHLSEHHNIIGIKDSSADIVGLSETIKRVPSDFAVLSGNGTVFHDALNVGAWGGILAVGCIAPRICLEIFRAFKAGENDRARALQEKLTPLARAVTTVYGIGGLKAALDLLNYTGGHVRLPLATPDGQAVNEISRALDDAYKQLGTSIRELTSDNQVNSHVRDFSPGQESSLVQEAPPA